MPRRSASRLRRNAALARLFSGVNAVGSHAMLGSRLIWAHMRNLSFSVLFVISNSFGLRVSMFPKKWIASLMVAGIAALLVLPQAQAQKPGAGFVNDDDVFMALRDAARRDDADKAAELADRLPDYAIPSYIDYYRLKPRIKTASEDEIRQFLVRYAGSAIADRLRNDWLLELGRQRDWARFDEQYPLF